QAGIKPHKAGQTTVAISAAGLTASLPVTITSAEIKEVGFVRDVEPVMAKLGCNAGTCHGAQKGKEGFRLSLRGYDPDFDYEQLTHDLLGRRFNRMEPEKSLMLQKPVGGVPHEGGKMLRTDSEYYAI